MQGKTPFDILVNNADTNRPKGFAEVSADDAVMDLNVRAACFVAQAFVRRFIGEKGSGSFINVSSQMRHVGALA